MQDRQTLQNSGEKQSCQWDCLLKLYMLVKSARKVSRDLYLEKLVYIGLTSNG